MYQFRQVSREKDIELCLRQGVEARGGAAFKFRSSVRGVPDRIVVMEGGRVFFIEMKTSRGRLSWPQERVHGVLRALGATVVVLRSLDDVVEFLESL
ncbi:VRR-NUC domain containing protein [uncultured Caudovirales phage]|uniref:VRR-NUC domain containing protein n=1 Tax=uncultured Caudovirales phage TaxID=2100421 RepID=A0A6J5NZP5_9CAUD|nr:VRR-NUC domain containing protein [uncultured Caudovirales phage]